MNRLEIVKALSQAKPELMSRFGIIRLALFGSMARDCSRRSSDLDILVAFDGSASSDQYFGVLFFLEDLLGRPVDLVTDKALRAEFRPFVERDAIHV